MGLTESLDWIEPSEWFWVTKAAWRTLFGYDSWGFASTWLIDTNPRVNERVPKYYSCKYERYTVNCPSFAIMYSVLARNPTRFALGCFWGSSMSEPYGGCSFKPLSVNQQMLPPKEPPIEKLRLLPQSSLAPKFVETFVVLGEPTMHCWVQQKPTRFWLADGEAEDSILHAPLNPADNDEGGMVMNSSPGEYLFRFCEMLHNR